MYKIIILVLIVILSGCESNEDRSIKRVDVEFRLADHEPGEKLIEYKFRDLDKKFFLHQDVLCNSNDLISAEVIRWRDEYAVEVKFSESGKIKWAEATGSNIGKNIAILVNDELVACPIIKARIDKGVAIINGRFTELRAEELVGGIRNK